MPARHRVYVIVAAWLYRALCRLYPHEFRARFGDELRADFEQTCREGAESRGALGVAVVLIRAATDVALNAGPAWHSTVAADAGARAACALMLVVVPGAVLLRLWLEPVSPPERWNRAAGLAMHCAFACLLALAVKRHVRVTLAVALIAAVELLAMSPPSVNGSFQFALSEALRLSLPISVVLALVSWAPIRHARPNV